VELLRVATVPRRDRQPDVLINQSSLTLATKAAVLPCGKAYVMPHFSSAIAAGRSPSMDVPTAASRSGQDGNSWYAVQ
jgi:hypothetical protein